MEIEIIRSNESNSSTIWKACQFVAGLDPHDFAEWKGGGITVDLSSSVPVVRRILDLFTNLTLGDIRALTDSNRHTVSNELRRLQEQLHKIKNQIPQNVQSAQVLNEFKGIYESNRSQLTHILAYIRPELADERLRTMFDEASARSQELGNLVDRAQQMFTQLQDVAAQAGVSKHAVTFSNASERHAATKSLWLKITVVLAVVTAVLGWITLVVQQPSNGQLADTILFTASRIFVLGVLSYALVWSGRTYRAEAHNQIVNEHRRDALATFETFAGATSDPATKNAVLVQSTQCIFAHRPSGYGEQSSDAASPSHMLELTRTLSGGDDKT